ncbi:MAG: HD-GYP domain-containing protein [Pseudobutyrivibrio sp.]|nr:HD-GYP domain-containing protein [Pseudobutyrivibrio sp.]
MTKEIDGFVSDLPVGCITETDIYTDRNVLLCPRMTIIDKKILESLSQYKGKIHAVVSYEGTKTKVISPKDLIPEPDDSMGFEDSFKHYAVESLTSLYSNIDDVKTLTKGVVEIGHKVCYIIDHSKELSVNLSKLKVCDEYTYKHSVDVGTMAAILSKALGENEKFVNDMAIAGLLHDIGKEKIPTTIINKPAKLSPDEFSIIKTHTVHGYNILKESSYISEDMRQGILNHHENLDGTGYPRGLKGERIGKMARILAIVDVYDALVTKRSYKEGKTPAQSIEIMFTMSNKFDMDIFKKFLSVVNVYPNGSEVTLSNGHKATVIRQNKCYPLRPVIKINEDNTLIDLATDHRFLSTVIIS